MSTKVHIIKAMVFPVVMYECESWTTRKLSTEESKLLKCGPGEDSWESLGQQRDQTVNPKGNQPWIFTGKTDAEAPILWPPDVKSWLIGKDPNAVKDWGQKEKGATENELVGWHHSLNGHEFEQTLGEMVKDREAWHATIHRVTKSGTQLSDQTRAQGCFKIIQKTSSKNLREVTNQPPKLRYISQGFPQGAKAHC